MKISVVFIFFILVTFSTFGQKDLDKLKAPSSPAASVLGIQPSTILIPKSYKALETSLFSNYFEANGDVLIPNDFGIEFTPYWATEPKMTIEEYLFPNPMESLVRNMSFSLASTQNYVLSDSINSYALGVGFRTAIYFTDENLKNKTIKDLDSLIDVKRLKNITLSLFLELVMNNSDSIQSKTEFVDLYIEALKNKDGKSPLFKNQDIMERTTNDLSIKLKALLPEYSQDTNGYFFKELNRILDDFWKVAFRREKIESFVSERPGLKLELAAAISINFPTNEFDFSIISQKSFWLTPSYTFNDKASFVKILGVLRFNFYDLNFYEKYFPNEEYFENNVDYGIGLSLNFMKFSFQFEGVGRVSKTIIERSTDANGVTTTKSVKKNDFQYVGTFNYQINDNMMVTYSLGKQFEPILNYKGTLISMLSLNFGFGGPTSDTISK